MLSALLILAYNLRRPFLLRVAFPRVKITSWAIIAISLYLFLVRTMSNITANHLVNGLSPQKFKDSPLFIRELFIENS